MTFFTSISKNINTFLFMFSGNKINMIFNNSRFRSSNTFIAIT